MTATTTLTKDHEITPISDQKGVEVFICDPGWFEEKKKYKISNAPDRTTSIEHSGAELNFLARILYAEAAGSSQLPDKTERDKEKEAILNVKHFRLGRTDYPNWKIKSKTFIDVCSAAGQFESYGPPPKPKFRDSTKRQVEMFSKKECSDFKESIDAIKNFLTSGPNSLFAYDNFRGGKGRQGATIGKSRFWLSATGKRLLDDED